MSEVIEPRELSEADAQTIAQLVGDVSRMFAGHDHAVVGVTLANLVAIWCVIAGGRAKDKTAQREALERMNADALTSIPMHEQLLAQYDTLIRMKKKKEH